MPNTAAMDELTNPASPISIAHEPIDDHTAIAALNMDDIIRLLPRTSERVACLCAEKLLRASLMTQRLADILLRRRDRSSLIVLSEGIGLSPIMVAHLAKLGSIEEARAIAACPTLSENTLLHLIARNDPMIDRIMAECSGEPLPDSVLHALTTRAFNDARLARILFSRTDLPSPFRASLFAHASPREKITILNLANQSASSRPHGVDPTRLNALSKAIETGDASTLTSLLSNYLNVSYDLLYTILSETSGATLALALKGMDLPSYLIRRACRWANTTHAGLPGGIEDVLETVSPSAALCMITTILSIAKANEPITQNRTDHAERLIA
jgi:uncharacterized protein (DUF2336 family)